MSSSGSRPPFIVLEGLDGSGKSTQQALLADWLRQRGLRVTCCRDPGDTELGVRLREILLDPHTPLQPITEALLFMAARSELVAQVIRPALQHGEWVVCDRFVLSTIVYQGYAGGAGADLIRQLGEASVQGTLPDLTLVLDLPVDLAARRCRRQDRFESRSSDFRQQVREGFLREARRRPRLCRVVDATGLIDDVQQRIRHEVESVLESHFRS